MRKKTSVSEIRTTYLQHSKRALYPLDQRKTKSGPPNFFDFKENLPTAVQYICCAAAASRIAGASGRTCLFDMFRLVFAHAHFVFGGVGRISMQL
jgi:hypothetical protein